MKKLETTLTLKGVGNKDNIATLVVRNDKAAIYKRGENIFEVFKIKISQATEAFGRKFEAQERYPSNESFGNWAWCHMDEASARKKFNEITTITENSSN